MSTQLTIDIILPHTTKKSLNCESKGEKGIFLWFRVKYMPFRGKGLAFLAEVSSAMCSELTSKTAFFMWTSFLKFLIEWSEYNMADLNA